MMLAGSAGAAAALFYGGMPWLLGFLTGAVFSAVNFWFFHRLVRRVGQTSTDDAAPRKASTVVFGTRYVLFVLGGYAMIKYFEASLSAALFGCFVAVAAVILEILYELTYGT
jgi:membrane protein implicated in regulation of membrane protease activity